MKHKIFISCFLIVASFLKIEAQAINTSDFLSKKLSSIATAGTVDTFLNGYTFAYATSGTPWNGSLLSFGGFGNQYDTQINSDYGPNGGKHISFRTRNGDISQWNNWNEIWHSGNLNNSSIDFNARNIIASGNVGIGTTNPLAKLEVKGNQNNTITAGTAIGKIVGNDAGFFMGSLAGSPSYGSWIQTMRDSDNLAFPMLINPLGGSVGIGTTTPDEKLAVNGTIHAKEVRVDLLGWPDYVFEKHYTGKSSLKPCYSLPTLAAIEAYTKANHHLPEVPSATEIAANGLKLGEMNGVLLQKIEELTLYAIEQEKKQAVLEKEIAQLKQLFLDFKK